MTHTVRYAVSGEIESTDSALLDNIESQLPDVDDVTLGNEFNKGRTTVLDEDGNENNVERLSAQMTFATQDELDKENVDTTPKEAALALFNQVTNADLADKADSWEIRVYLTPEGGVTTGAVQAWYEQNPDEQPTREVDDRQGGTTSESYIPTSWQPDNHEIASDSG